MHRWQSALLHDETPRTLERSPPYLSWHACLRMQCFIQPQPASLALLVSLYWHY